MMRMITVLILIYGITFLSCSRAFHKKEINLHRRHRPARRLMYIGPDNRPYWYYRNRGRPYLVPYRTTHRRHRNSHEGPRRRHDIHRERSPVRSKIDHRNAQTSKKEVKHVTNVLKQTIIIAKSATVIKPDILDRKDKNYKGDQKGEINSKDVGPWKMFITESGGAKDVTKVIVVTESMPVKDITKKQSVTNTAIDKKSSGIPIPKDNKSKTQQSKKTITKTVKVENTSNNSVSLEEILGGKELEKVIQTSETPQTFWSGGHLIQIFTLGQSDSPKQGNAAKVNITVPVSINNTQVSQTNNTERKKTDVLVAKEPATEKIVILNGSTTAAVPVKLVSKGAKEVGNLKTVGKSAVNVATKKKGHKNIGIVEKRVRYSDVFKDLIQGLLGFMLGPAGRKLISSHHGPVHVHPGTGGGRNSKQTFVDRRRQATTAGPKSGPIIQIFVGDQGNKGMGKSSSNGHSQRQSGRQGNPGHTIRNVPQRKIIESPSGNVQIFPGAGNRPNFGHVPNINRNNNVGQGSPNIEVLGSSFGTGKPGISHLLGSDLRVNGPFSPPRAPAQTHQRMIGNTRPPETFFNNIRGTEGGRGRGNSVLTGRDITPQRSNPLDPFANNVQVGNQQTGIPRSNERVRIGQGSAIGMKLAGERHVQAPVFSRRLQSRSAGGQRRTNSPVGSGLRGGNLKGSQVFGGSPQSQSGTGNSRLDSRIGNGFGVEKLRGAPVFSGQIQPQSGARNSKIEPRTGSGFGGENIRGAPVISGSPQSQTGAGNSGSEQRMGSRFGGENIRGAPIFSGSPQSQSGAGNSGSEPRMGSRFALENIRGAPVFSGSPQSQSGAGNSGSGPRMGNRFGEENIRGQQVFSGSPQPQSGVGNSGSEPRMGSRFGGENIRRAPVFSGSPQPQSGVGNSGSEPRTGSRFGGENIRGTPVFSESPHPQSGVGNSGSPQPSSGVGNSGSEPRMGSRFGGENIRGAPVFSGRPQPQSGASNSGSGPRMGSRFGGENIRGAPVFSGSSQLQSGVGNSGSDPRMGNRFGGENIGGAPVFSGSPQPQTDAGNSGSKPRMGSRFGGENIRGTPVFSGSPQPHSGVGNSRIKPRTGVGFGGENLRGPPESPHPQSGATNNRIGTGFGGKNVGGAPVFSSSSPSNSGAGKGVLNFDFGAGTGRGPEGMSGQQESVQSNNGFGTGQGSPGKKANFHFRTKRRNGTLSGGNGKTSVGTGGKHNNAHSGPGTGNGPSGLLQKFVDPHIMEGLRNSHSTPDVRNNGHSTGPGLGHGVPSEFDLGNKHGSSRKHGGLHQGNTEGQTRDIFGPKIGGNPQQITSGADLLSTAISMLQGQGTSVFRDVPWTDHGSGSGGRNSGKDAGGLDNIFSNFGLQNSAGSPEINTATGIAGLGGLIDKSARNPQGIKVANVGSPSPGSGPLDALSRFGVDLSSIDPGLSSGENLLRSLSSGRAEGVNIPSTNGSNAIGLSEFGGGKGGKSSNLNDFFHQIVSQMLESQGVGKGGTGNVKTAKSQSGGESQAAGGSGGGGHGSNQAGKPEQGKGAGTGGPVANQDIPSLLEQLLVPTQSTGKGGQSPDIKPSTGGQSPVKGFSAGKAGAAERLAPDQILLNLLLGTTSPSPINAEGQGGGSGNSGVGSGNSGMASQLSDMAMGGNLNFPALLRTPNGQTVRLKLVADPKTRKARFFLH